MKLLFLGTSAGRPTAVRNVTSIALVFPEDQNRFWLFDAGEGTQQQLLRSRLKLGRLSRIFITHMHGDHLYGLPGILSSRTYFEGASKLELYGPPGIRAYVDSVLHYSGAHLNYELEVHEIQEDGRVLDDGKFKIEAGELIHRVRSFGYRIEEHPRPGPLNLAYLAERGAAPGPMYGKLKRGEDIVLPDGTVIRAADAVGPRADGRILAIMGDTVQCDKAAELAKDADLLVHEATFGIGLEEKAALYGHSTFLQAAETAARAHAKRLVVSHISARYGDEEVASLIEQVRSVFPDTEAAFDFKEVCI
ncbi:ribonuclease Z [Cohnella sp. JJ-181]|uniref:ribonuclease Z n=1 Tax=Cohnella rhizoplanae TaxID=2974897 RepID=UPI0022FFA0C9|nr:ribonuclease Z [Cohnella sp. JJ-181]CAI6032687.1 Ribonuclease Z [Cohnella sp. JJ-181]